jgi:hypothetical protein
LGNRNYLEGELWNLPGMRSKIWRFAAVFDHPLSSRFFDLADIHDRPGIEIGVG